MFVITDDWSDKASESGSGQDDDGGDMDADENDPTGSAVTVSKPKKQAKASNVAAQRKSHLNIVFIGHVGKYSFLLISK